MKNMKSLGLLVFLLSISMVNTFEATKVSKETYGGGVGASGDAAIDNKARADVAALTKTVEKAKKDAEKAHKEAVALAAKAAKAQAAADEAREEEAEMYKSLLAKQARLAREKEESELIDKSPDRSGMTW